MAMKERMRPADIAAADAAAERRLSGIPWTLWRHLAWELLRVLAVTTGIIVTVIAFGAAAKPLAESSIGADTVLKYVSLAIIPMLQYALPFAAGFAATLVLHRFATDNEIVAMATAGMSYRRIFAPVLLIGTGLGVVMFILVAFVIPHFWTRMVELATSDATQMLVASVRRGEALSVDRGRLMIYADSVEVVDPPAETGAQRRLLLTGVAAIEAGKRGTIEPQTEFTAESAALDLYSAGNGTLAKVAFSNATIFRPGEGAIVSVPRAEPEAASLASGFYRGPKFLPLDELIALRRDPNLASIVRDAKRRLQGPLGEIDLWRCLEKQAASGALSFEEPNSPRALRIEGARIVAGELLPVAGRTSFTVTESVQGRPSRRCDAERGVLRAISEAGFEPRMSLSVPAPLRVRDLAAGLPGRWPSRIDDLLPVGCVPRRWDAAPTAEYLAAFANLPNTDGVAPYASIRKSSRTPVRVLEVALDDVVFESDSHLAQRAAQPVSIVLVLLLGAMLAVVKRSALPLTVYVLAFIPAIVNILMISGGQQAMRDGWYVAGSAVMWGGNALLLAALWASWASLRRT
jgi:hypothetical protein